MAIIILTRSGIFTQDIRSWELEKDKDWKKCKTHFKKAQTELRRHAAPISDLEFHRSNANAEQVLSHFQNRHNEEEQETEVANTAVQDDLHVQLERLQKQVQQLMTRNTEKRNTQKRPNGRSNSRSRRSAYCWTHGLCSHGGSHFRMNDEGHIDEATVENRQGGSSSVCAWLNVE